MQAFAAFLFSHSALGVLAAGETPGDEGVDTYREMLSDPWFVKHSIIICALLVFLLACFIIRRRRRTMQIFTNAGGNVHVSHAALADLVENTARDFGAVSRPQAYFRQRGGKLHVWVRLKIGPGQRLPQYSSLLQMRVAEALREAFGISELGGVHLVVTAYTGTPPLPEPSAVPYHGASPAKSARPARPAAAPAAEDDYFGTH